MHRTGPWLIAKLRSFQIKQHIREDGLKSPEERRHADDGRGADRDLDRDSTLLWAACGSSMSGLRFSAWRTRPLASPTITESARRRNLGLTARKKFLRSWVCVRAGEHSAGHERPRMYNTKINVPFEAIQAGLADHICLASYRWRSCRSFVSGAGDGGIVECGESDGWSGYLAIGLMVIASGALTMLTYAGGHSELASSQLERNAHSSVTIFCAAMTGASMGFLWYNAHPAEVFMGDVGSLALGGGMGVVAVLLKQEVLLLFIGGVYVIECLSVILQVGSYKLRGKRIFKMAPLHHHFEALGWQESKIIARFWIAGLVMALFALTTLKLR